MRTIAISSSVLGLLFLLSACATDPSNDPHSGGFFGGVRGLTSGDYEARQQALRGERDQTLNELQALREEGDYLESERRMKAAELAEQRRRLASLKAKNRQLANRIKQIERSRTSTERRTAHLRQKQKNLSRNIRKFEKQLDRGQLTTKQANAKRLSLENQYNAIKDL